MNKEIVLSMVKLLKNAILSSEEGIDIEYVYSFFKDQQ